jgi:hypothetical protein
MRARIILKRRDGRVSQPTKSLHQRPTPREKLAPLLTKKPRAPSLKARLRHNPHDGISRIAGKKKGA